MSETLTGKQLAAEARAAYQRGEYIDAALTFDAAANSYELAGDELMNAEMRNNSSVAYLMAGDAVSALGTVDGTPAVFAAHGDSVRQGMAFGNMGAALEGLNRLDEAIQAFRQASELLHAAGESELHLRVAQSLSALQIKTGHQLEALATMQSGLAEVKKPTPMQRFLKKLIDYPMRMLRGPS